MMWKALSGLASPGGRYGCLCTLFFHRVLSEPDPLAPWEPTAAQFETLLDWLESQVHIVPLADAVVQLAQGSLAPRAAAITFDDGYRDNFEVAMPILKRRGIPATFFVAAGFLDGGTMWNDIVIESLRQAEAGTLVTHVNLPAPIRLHDSASRLHASNAFLKAVKYQPSTQRMESVLALARHCGSTVPGDLMMSSAQVVGLHAAGFGIGAHTDVHPILSRLDDQSACDDIARGRDRLVTLTGAPVDLFAYPNGRRGDDFLARHARMVESLGFSAAFTTERGVATRASDRFELPRYTPWSRDRWRFQAQLLSNMTHRSRVSA